VPEVAQQPPKPGRAARAAVVVGDDEDAVLDPGPRGGGGKTLRARQRVPSLPLERQIRELADPEKRRAGDVGLEVRLSPRLDAREVVPAVDEAVDQ
jgi:hypothetical protein